MWFDSWADLARVVLVGTAAYGALVLVLRVSGKRTLSQLNAFDFIVTVALGSTLATILLSSDVSFTEGLIAIALLVTLQWVVAIIASRWPGARSAITSHPRVVLRDGQFDADALAACRLAEADVRQAVRASGSGDVADIAVVVLETNGTLSVIRRQQIGDGSALGSLA
ncbi:DUF421 domain-containing protein [Microcella sp.]|uniref:DUF421 domain-containing protein n=1 Tax=Microcella sp. TaxID=1913979 RepID=UPI002568BF51|nr:YetF domain-containing protein [Microcella sp.]MBX9471417.1 DUF421 domain-containing protein [Microcella sp.]MBX9473107.1 DUF421 domain-containing protein [Microcella sp.]